MDRRQRDLRRMAEGEGLREVRIEHTKGTHLRLTGRHRGCCVCLTCALTTSDRRSDLNLRSTLRRQMREIECTNKSRH